MPDDDDQPRPKRSLEDLEKRPIVRLAKWLIVVVVVALIGAFITSLQLFSGQDPIVGSLPDDSQQIFSKLDESEGAVVGLDIQVDSVGEPMIEIEDYSDILPNDQGETPALIMTAWKECPSDAGEPMLDMGEQAGKCNGDRLVFMNSAQVAADILFDSGMYYIRGHYSVGTSGPLKPYVNAYGSSTRVLRAVRPEDAPN